MKFCRKRTEMRPRPGATQISQWPWPDICDTCNWDTCNWDTRNWDTCNWDTYNWDTCNWDTYNWDTCNWSISIDLCEFDTSGKKDKIIWNDRKTLASLARKCKHRGEAALRKHLRNGFSISFFSCFKFSSLTFFFIFQISISQTFPDFLEHGRKNPDEHSIESKTRIKKPETWNFIKNLNIFGSKQKIQKFSKKFIFSNISRIFSSVVGIAVHWNQNKNQKQEVENQINSKFTAKSKKNKNEKTHFLKKLKILKFSKFFSSVERKFR